MINFETEDEIEFTERELKLKSLFVEIDRMIGGNCDFESMVDEKEMTIDEMKTIAIDSLEGYIDAITEFGLDEIEFGLDEIIENLEYIEKYQRYITRVENI